MEYYTTSLSQEHRLSNHATSGFLNSTALKICKTVDRFNKGYSGRVNFGIKSYTGTRKQYLTTTAIAKIPFRVQKPSGWFPIAEVGVHTGTDTCTRLAGGEVHVPSSSAQWDTGSLSAPWASRGGQGQPNQFYFPCGYYLVEVSCHPTILPGFIVPSWGLIENWNTLMYLKILKLPK